MILLEELVVSTLKAAGIRASTKESASWKGDYVIFQRTGGLLDQFGNAQTGWTNREYVELDFNVYSSSPAEALRLGYATQKACRAIEVIYSPVSNVGLSSLSQLPDFNEQSAYTFGLTATVYQETL